MADADQGPEDQTTQSVEGPRGAPIQGPSIRAGDVVGPYEIVEEIGRGGMGVVYRARHGRLGKDVALKCPYPRLAADPANRKRFLREARAYSRLSGPNIVHVFDTFEHAGLPWLALQLVEGPSLEELLETHGKIEPRTALSYAEDIAKALDLAHRHGVLHRDIKPRNVLITQDDQVLLTDFGLARFIPSEEHGLPESTQSSLTETGAIVGTPRYMAPEQALGKPIDPRTDIYSWGAVVYEMLTGEPLFKKKKLGSLIDEIMHHEPEPISRFTYEVPEEFERIIRKAIAKDPRDRYQSTADLLVDLRTLRRQLDGTPAVAPPETTRPIGRGWIAAAALVPLAIVLVWVLRARSAPDPIPVGTPVQVTSDPVWEGEPAVSPDGSRIAYVAKDGANDDIYVVSVAGGNPLRLTTHAAADTDPAWLPDGSAIVFTSQRAGFPGIWKVPQLGGGAIELITNGEQPAISADGEWISFSRATPPTDELRVFVAPMQDPSAGIELTHAGEGVWGHESPAWAPDGEELCYFARHGLWLVSRTGGDAKKLTTGDHFDYAPAWGPDGRHIYFSSLREGTRAIWRTTPDGTAPQRVTLGTGPESHPSISRDGKTLAYSTQSESFVLMVLNANTGERRRLSGGNDEWQAALSPAADEIVIVSARSGGVDLWSQTLGADGMPVGQPRQRTDLSGRVNYPSFSPDGNWLLFYRILGEERSIWTLPASGGQPTRITDMSPSYHPAWSPDGARVAFVSETDGLRHIWTIPVTEGRSAGNARRLTDGPTDCQFPIWSPDGRTLAFVGTDDTATEIWSVPSDASKPARRITDGADPRAIRWLDDTHILVSGMWNGNARTLGVVDTRSGGARPFEPPVTFGPPMSPGAFDVSRDGHLVVYAEQLDVGDVWVLRTESGVY